MQYMLYLLDYFKNKQTIYHSKQSKNPLSSGITMIHKKISWESSNKKEVFFSFILLMPTFLIPMETDQVQSYLYWASYT